MSGPDLAYRVRVLGVLALAGLALAVAMFVGAVVGRAADGVRGVSDALDAVELVEAGR